MSDFLNAVASGCASSEAQALQQWLHAPIFDVRAFALREWFCRSLFPVCGASNDVKTGSEVSQHDA